MGRAHESPRLRSLRRTGRRCGLSGPAGRRLGRLGLDGLVSIHTNLLTPALGDARALSASPPSHEDKLRSTHSQSSRRPERHFVEQATRPETIGYALLDSPIAMAAWILDHDTDAYYKIARAFVDGKPSGNLTRDNILDNITMYWLTGTGASAARCVLGGRPGNRHRAVGHAPTPVSIPVGFTTFPGEIWRTPRSWVEKAYPNVIYFNEVDKGGHFAAWEEPELFANEIRATFRPVR